MFKSVFIVNFEQVNADWVVKGYLRYKTITSRNVPSQAQIKNFLFRRNIVFRS